MVEKDRTEQPDDGLEVRTTEAALAALSRYMGTGTDLRKPVWNFDMTKGLGIMLPDVIAEVREQVAREIEADRACHQELMICPGCQAARIARGVASS